MKRKVLLLNTGDIIIDNNRELLIRHVSNGMIVGEFIIHYKDLSTGKSDWMSENRNTEFKIKERK